MRRHRLRAEKVVRIRLRNVAFYFCFESASFRMEQLLPQSLRIEERSNIWHQLEIGALTFDAAVTHENYFENYDENYDEDACN